MYEGTSDAFTAPVSISNSFRKTVNSIHEWATNQRSCGSNENEHDAVVYFENGKRQIASGLADASKYSLFDEEGESKFNEDSAAAGAASSPYFQALRCTARDISFAARRSFNCPVASDDLSCNSEEDQMRRLGSWGTFGTLATNESLETNADDLTIKYDDNGTLIDPVILEKAKQNREKFRTRKRAVQFAYPPITSLKQCPRVDPTDLDKLFFSTEELDTYENDRRSTGTVDDVEIVAVSTSLSEDVDPPKIGDDEPACSIAPCTGSTRSNTSSISDWSQKSGLAKFLSSPNVESRGRGSQQRQSSNATTKRRAQTPGPGRNREPFSYEEKPKEKRLLKSVQIFLRARSTGG